MDTTINKPKNRKSLMEMLKGLFKGKGIKSEKKRRKETMADEIKKDEKEIVEEKNEKVATEQPQEQAKVEQPIEQPQTAEEQPQETATAQPQVAEAEPMGNGIRVEDLVTKDELAQMISALGAKLDAVIKENADLKNANEQIRTKYEDNGDFGTEQKKGLDADARTANETFDEYSKRFM